MKCQTCLNDIDDDWILEAAKKIKKDRLTPEEILRRSEIARKNVTNGRWAKVKERGE